MNERKRIFDLVKQGVISTEEALVLLENIAKETGRREKTSDDDISQNDLFISSDCSFDEESSMAISDELTQLDHFEHQIDAINIQLIEINENLQFEESAELFQQKCMLQDELTKLIAEKQDLEAKIDEKFYHKTNQHTQIENNPWKEQASDTFSQVSDKLSDLTTQLGRFFKKSIKNVSQTVEDNVEWKELSIKVPGLAVTSIEHEFSFQENQPTILDFKLANGSIDFITYDQEDIKIKADIKIYGKFDESDSLAAVMKRSTIELTSDKLVFYLPNKRIKADLVVYLPKKTYDYISARVLNGDVTFNHMQGKDFFVKVMNGDIDFQDTIATMIELEGTNGDIKVIDSRVNDIVVETVNGDVRVSSTPETAKINLINGDVKLTFTKDVLLALNVNSVNGDIKVAMPQNNGYELSAKTNFGSIQSRLKNVELVEEINEKMNHQLSLRRLGNTIAKVNLSSNTGSIYIK